MKRWCRRRSAPAATRSIPGYGFLSERAAVRAPVRAARAPLHRPDCGAARSGRRQAAGARRGAGAGVPVVPGGAVQSRETRRTSSPAQIGCPLLVKAVGGGGGRGMKLVDAWRISPRRWTLAAAEAGAAFGDARVYLERFVGRARHVEVQVLGDGDGQRGAPGRTRLLGAAALPEAHRGDARRRDCRPSCAAPARGGAALRRAAEISRRGHGGVPASTCTRGEFYFLEMNARIQVEHPVTETVTRRRPRRGADRDRRGRQGLRAGARQNAVARGSGCAIECRINAEDPAHDFTPSPGTGDEARWPTGEGIRVDTHIDGRHAGCRRTTIRCWPRSSRTARSRRLRSRACARRWRRRASRAWRPTWHSTPAVLADARVPRRRRRYRVSRAPARARPAHSGGRSG